MMPSVFSARRSACSFKILLGSSFVVLRNVFRPERDYPVAITVGSNLIDDAENFMPLYECQDKEAFIQALKTVLSSEEVNSNIIFRHTARPSIPGILISNRIRSGTAATFRSASSPLYAVNTSDSLGVRVQMERLRNMGLRRSFFLLSAGCLAAALLLTAAIYSVCDRLGTAAFLP